MRAWRNKFLHRHLNFIFKEKRVWPIVRRWPLKKWSIVSASCLVRQLPSVPKTTALWWKKRITFGRCYTTLAPPNAHRYQQLHNTVEVHRAIGQQLKKSFCLFLGHCINGLLFFLWRVDLSHRILRYHFLLLGIAKYQVERPVLMA